MLMNRFGLAVISLVLVLATGPASAVTVIKIATLVPENSSYGSKIKAARAEIKERTEGRVILKVYYGGTQGQGDAATVKKMIRIGQLQGGTFTPTDFQDKMPNLNLYGLPFVFESIEEVNYVRKRMDELLAEGFAEEGFVTFGFAGDFSIILSNVPVRGLGDLKGRKVWLPEGDAISDQAMKKLRLVPNSKPLSDVLIGLRTGLFDVVTIPPTAAVLLQLHTAVKYFTDMPVVYAMEFMAIQKQAFDKLSAEDQVVMRDVLTRVYSELNDESPAEAVNAKEALVSSGLESIVPDEGEFERLQKVMAENSRDQAKQGMFSLELLEKMQSHLDEYRSEQADNHERAITEDEAATRAAADSS
jgi:TRAP-type C4-dicarboxylate transport system substrate-binding protein